MMTATLDQTFAALSDPTRRAILARLAGGEATVNELVAPFSLSQPAISKHLKVLERAGLIRRGRDAQRRPCRIEAQPLAEASAWLEGYRKVWEASFDRLDALLDELKAETNESEGSTRMRQTLRVTADDDRSIVVTRHFDAPRALVWDTMSRPELIKRWLSGPAGWEMTVCEDDPRVGGTFRWEWAGPDGAVLAMTGDYLEFVPPERCVRTERFDGPGMPPMCEQLATLVLADRGETTTLTLTVLYPSREARDGALAGGMDRGLSASYDRLDETLRVVA